MIKLLTGILLFYLLDLQIFSQIQTTGLVKNSSGESIPGVILNPVCPVCRQAGDGQIVSGSLIILLAIRKNSGNNLIIVFKVSQALNRNKH